MTIDDAGGDVTLAPDEAFGVLGSETRMEILRILAEADDPVSFSELYDRGSATDSGNFTYHLDKLVDVHMMVVTGGRERTESEYAELFEEAGFEHVETHRSDEIPMATVEGRAV